MVAVPGTLGKAFDGDLFKKEVCDPVKHFLRVTDGRCRVLVFFLVGHGSENEEKIVVPLPEQNEAVGCASYLAAEMPEYLGDEIKRGLVWLKGIEESDPDDYPSVLNALMTEHGVTERHILSPRQLYELSSEILSTAT